MRCPPPVTAATFPLCPDGSALVDTGAGREAFVPLQQKLCEHDLTAIVLPQATRTAKSSGAKSTSMFICGVPRTIEATLIDEDVPHIESVGSLNMLGTMLDLSTNLAVFTNV